MEGCSRQTHHRDPMCKLHYTRRRRGRPLGLVLRDRVEGAGPERVAELRAIHTERGLSGLLAYLEDTHKPFWRR